MALITHECSSRGASISFTIDDVLLRATNIAADTRSRQVRVELLDALGNVAQQVVVPANTQQSSPINFAARTVQIERPDTTVKSYVCPAFRVFF